MLNTRKTATQARGRARREELLDAAQDLLATHMIDSLSLGDIARHAGAAKGSAYHFFTNVQDLYAALVQKIGSELCLLLDEPIQEPVTCWQDVVSICIDRGVLYYAHNPAARQLLIGPKTPPEIKRRDRANDIDLGRSLENQINTLFELPNIADRSVLFFRAIEITDLMFCLSMMDNGEITPAMAAEAKKASIAYLEVYIPKSLGSRIGPV